MSYKTRLRRGALAWHRRLREARLVARNLWDRDRPVLAHMIPTRRCNIACTYCNEFDHVSSPVPAGELFRRVDRLAELGVSVITFSGGEPMLHPRLEDVIRRVREHGVIASLITNGYFMVPERIQGLNEAGLEYVQISIDNVQPDETSKKSLKVLDKKLVWMAEHAEFHVNINSVLGSGVRNPEDAYTIARRARELGFTSTVGIIHDHRGQLKPLSPHESDVYQRIKRMGKGSYSRITHFQDALAQGRVNHWRCRAGGRYLYICEEGLVHYCSQQRGMPGIPIEDYTTEHIRQAYLTEKPCAPRCTVSCVHKVSVLDAWRDPQPIKILPVAVRPKSVEPEPVAQLQSGD